MESTKRITKRKSAPRKKQQPYFKKKYVETKYHDASDTDDVTTTPTISLLNGLSPGSGMDNRIGRVITMKSLLLQARLNLESSALDQAGRFLVVYDKQANGAAPGITDILVSSSVVSLKNLNNRNRFVILMDRTIDMNNLGGGLRSYSFKEYINLKNFTTVYNAGTDGTITDIVTGSLFMVYLGTVAAGTVDTDCLINQRLAFTDA